LSRTEEKIFIAKKASSLSKLLLPIFFIKTKIGDALNG